MATCGALMGGSAAYCGYRIGKGIVNCCRGRNLTPKPIVQGHKVQISGTVYSIINVLRPTIFVGTRLPVVLPIMLMGTIDPFLKVLSDQNSYSSMEGLPIILPFSGMMMMHYYNRCQAIEIAPSKASCWW